MANKILLDYAFPVTLVQAIAAASTGFLKQAALICKPKSGQEGNVGQIYECSTTGEVAARTDNVNSTRLFAAGLTKVFIVLADDLDVALTLEEHPGEFYTLIVSSDFDDEDIELEKSTGNATITNYANLLTTTPDTIEIAGTVFVAQAGEATPGDSTFQAATSNEATAANLAAQVNAHPIAKTRVEALAAGAICGLTAKLPGAHGNAYLLAYTDNGTETVGATVSGPNMTGGSGFIVGTFDGVTAIATEDAEFADEQRPTHVAFFGNEDPWGNMCFAFGKLLSNLNSWLNQQFIPMPIDDGINTLGLCNTLFDNRISFVLTDGEAGNVLGMFCHRGKAIVAPYILKNLQVDMQSRAVQWISVNQPQYTNVNATLLETRLQEDVINNNYVARGWLTGGTVNIELLQDNFVASGQIEVPTPTAMWRVFNDMRAV